jgi:3-methyladenine DNA glycosylase AlkC
MAEPLKNKYGPEVPRRIGRMLAAAWPKFPARAFLADALDGYESLELMPRARQVASALHRHLPPDYPRAIAILLESLGPRSAPTSDLGLGSFLYLPHVFFVAAHGLGHFEESMRAQYELTQRFTAEFSIRAYLVHHREATLERLAQWSGDPDVHVRRLVSEGTRPRLPWAPRLREFQRDPTPVLALLERLKDDPELYVRRSVANNLNDIGKDHPQRLVEVARRWMRGATPQRRWIVGHALRSAVKRADPGALAVMGFGVGTPVRLRAVSIAPARPTLGGAVTIGFELHNASRQPQRVLVDLRVHFVKSAGATGAKVFKLKAVSLEPGASVALRKTISLAPLTTRKHYAGQHRVEALLNGESRALGSFELRGA